MCVFVCFMRSFTHFIPSRSPTWENGGKVRTIGLGGNGTCAAGEYIYIVLILVYLLFP